MMRDVAQWVEAVCRLPVTFNSGSASILELMTPVRPYLSDRGAFLAAVGGWLAEHPEVVDAWQVYSFDKRTPAGPYLDLRSGSHEVGFYDDGRHDVTTHADAVGACTDFIYREATWVLKPRAS
jgi:hypothetical protein